MNTITELAVGQESLHIQIDNGEGKYVPIFLKFDGTLLVAGPLVHTAMIAENTTFFVQNNEQGAVLSLLFPGTMGGITIGQWQGDQSQLQEWVQKAQAIIDAKPNLAGPKPMRN